MPNDGVDRLDDLDAEDEEEVTVEGETPPTAGRFSIFIIDEKTHPTAYCPNGHVTEWGHEEYNSRLANIYRFEATRVVTVCGVCGVDGPVSENREKPDGAQEASGA